MDNVVCNELPVLLLNRLNFYSICMYTNTKNSLINAVNTTMFVKIIYLHSHYPIEMMSLPGCFHDFKVILQE